MYIDCDAIALEVKKIIKHTIFIWAVDSFTFEDLYLEIWLPPQDT